MYRCVHETLDSEYPITDQRREILHQVVKQIERSVEDLEERIDLSNQRELEATDSGAGMTEGLGAQGGMHFE